LLETKILIVSPVNPERNIINFAAEVLHLGGLVAFPTETVYGLGADAFNPDAVKKVFEAKGRPADNPLIVHIAEYDQLEELTDHIPQVGKILAEAFWPGPLTLVVKSSKFVPDVITAGLETVAIRMPDNKVALELIKALNSPIVGPSANISGRPSPTLAQHVYDDLNGKINLILDAGPTHIGLESTVMDVSTQPPLILRFGGLVRERIEQLIGEVQTSNDEKMLRRSPGTMHRHYSPEAKVVLIERGDTLAFEQLYKKYSDEGKKVGFIVYSITVSSIIKSSYGKIIPNDIENYSRLLFQMLRDLDKLEIDVILVESVEEKGLGKAMMDRLTKASHQ